MSCCRFPTRNTLDLTEKLIKSLESSLDLTEKLVESLESFLAALIVVRLWLGTRVVVVDIFDGSVASSSSSPPILSSSEPSSRVPGSSVPVDARLGEVYRSHDIRR